MCFKRKTKEIQINSKYKLNNHVSFHSKNRFLTGKIVKIYLKDDKVNYSIQVGGECPYIVDDVKDNDITVFIK